jgi:hypothetical protein
VYKCISGHGELTVLNGETEVRVPFGSRAINDQMSIASWFGTENETTPNG